MVCSYLSLCYNLGRLLPELTGLPRTPHRKKRLKVHSTSPRMRKSFQGQRGLGEFPTHSLASGVDIVPWDTVWTKTVQFLVLLHYKQVKHLRGEQTHIRRVSRGIVWKIFDLGPLLL